jgi:hypothetical protein
MKHFPLILILLVSLSSCQAQEPPKAPPSLPPIEVHFSPKGGCTEAVVKEINAAKMTILVQAYSFTSVPIAKALVEGMMAWEHCIGRIRRLQLSPAKLMGQ